MACVHKFAAFLDLESLDFGPETLIVGTFNPSWPKENAATWFYGRTETSLFWEILPRLYGAASMIDRPAAEWMKFCADKKIALTDLIRRLGDAEPENPAHVKMLAGYSDDAIAHNFDDFEYVDIVGLLRKQPSIRHVYLTRGISQVFWRHLWNPVMHYCSVHHIHERRLLTPTADARLLEGMAHLDDPDQKIEYPDAYLLKKWRKAWHF